MANWGAFAGGLGKGYMQADDMYQTRKRTAAIEEESRIRGEANTRANEEMEWKRKRQQREEALQAGMQEIVQNAQWKKREDGTWDPRDPENQPVWDSVLLQQAQLKMKNGDMPLNELKAIEDLQAKFKSQKAQKAGQKYMSTGDLTALNDIPDSGFDFTGAQEVPIKEGWGSYTGIKLANGQVIPKYVVVGMVNKDAGAAMQADVDNRRQGAIATEQIANMRRDDARAASEFSTRQGEKNDPVRKIESKVSAKSFPSYFASMDGKPIDDRDAPYLVRDIAVERFKKGGDEQDMQRQINDAYKVVRKASDDVWDRIKDDPKYKGLKSDTERARYFDQKRRELVELRLNPPAPGQPQPAAPAAAPVAQPTAQPVQKNGRVYTRGGSYQAQDPRGTAF